MAALRPLKHFLANPIMETQSTCGATGARESAKVDQMKELPTPRRAPLPPLPAGGGTIVRVSALRIWRQWSLGMQMLAGFAIPVLIVLMASGYVTSSIDLMREASRAFDESNEALSLRNRMLTAVLDSETSVRGYLLTGDATYLNRYRLADRELRDAVRRLEYTDATEPAHLSRIHLVRDLYGRWRAQFAEPAIEARQGDTDQLGPKALALLHAQHGATLVALMREQLGLSDREEEQERAQSLARSLAIAERARWIAMLAPAVALLAGLAATLLLLVDALRGLRAVNRAAQAVAAGDLDRRMRVLRTDEIGRLGQTFNRMAADLADRRRRSDAIARFQSLLATSGSRDELVGVACEACRQVFPAAGAVYLREHGEIFVPVAWWEWPHERAPERKLLSRECRALSHALPHYSDGAPHCVECAHVRQAPSPVSRSLCLPLIAHGTNLGLLHLFVAGTGLEGPLSRRDLETAQLVAAQLAVAIDNLALRESLRQQAMHDALTGLFNRRSLDELLDMNLASAARDGSCISVAIIDVDHFKAVNDHFGHEAGDAVLAGLAEVLAAGVRSSDVVGRYGGEEFLLVMPATPHSSAVARAEELRSSIASNPVGGYAVTVSIGVATVVGASKRDQLVTLADKRLYAAKAGGRNCVVGANMSSRGDERSTR